MPLWDSLACAIKLYLDWSCDFLGEVPLVQRLSNRVHLV
jgi:hypothetical protein